MNHATQHRNAKRAADRKAVSAFWAKAEKHDAEKLAAAKVILADVARFGGETAGVVISARIVLRNAAERKAAQ